MTIRTNLKNAMLASGIIFAAAAAQAATVTIGDDNFDVTTITGSFADNQDVLESQAWWGDLTLASTFAETLGDALGTPNNAGEGAESPWFAYDPLGTDLVSIFFFSPDTAEAVTAGSNTLTDIGTYAVATLIDIVTPPTEPTTPTEPTMPPVAAVPLPAGGLLLLSALGLVALRGRKKRTA